MGTTKQYFLLGFLLWLLVMACSCSNTKNLPKGEWLYTGSEVVIEDREAGKKERGILKTDLEGLIRPRPNTKALGIRLKLMVYTHVGQPKKPKGWRHKLRAKMGEPPVLTSQVNLSANQALLANFLENRGFFYSSITARFDTMKRRKAHARVLVTTGPQYKINEVHFKADATQISKDIQRIFAESMLKPGGPYNLGLIKAERERIDRQLKESGYFYFLPDYLLFIADSSIGGHKVNLYMKLKHKEIPEEAYTPYVINDITIFPDYRLQRSRRDSASIVPVEYDGYTIVSKKNEMKPSALTRAMVFEKGDLYSLDQQNATLSRLVNMGTFKFVKNEFIPVGDSLLNVNYYLTPFPRKSLRFEVGALTQNDNRAGTKGSVSWRNKNAFKGAEELLFKVQGAVELQYSGPVKQPDIYNFGVETNLSFPRFVVPFVQINTNSQYLPRSVVKLKYSYESASGLMTIHSYNGAYGYNWKEGQHKEHQLYPFNFTYVRTDTLGSASLATAQLSSIVFTGIILGPTYQFTYNSAVGSHGKGSIYFDGRIDLSGNILGLMQKADYETHPATLFGAVYAQYVKLAPDLRYYYKLAKGSVVASRLFAGIGIPYGNSRTLPNIKQFWAGGNSDLRGFPSRLVGPGTFSIYEGQQDGNTYIQTLGDVKLEMNVELRQDIYKFLKAGAFIDAGNIWLYRDNPAYPGGTLSRDFYKQLAANTGLGIRLDFGIFVLRADMGMPIRKPWLPSGEQWVLDEINFKDKNWRRNNMILNIAIGYPF